MSLRKTRESPRYEIGQAGKTRPVSPLSARSLGIHLSGVDPPAAARPALRKTTRVVVVTKKLISDQDQVQAIYFDPRSDQGPIIFVILRKRDNSKLRSYLTEQASRKGT